MFSLFVLGGQQPGLRATHQARNNFTLIAFPRVLIKHRQKLRIYAAARGLEAVMFVASGAGEMMVAQARVVAADVTTGGQILDIKSIF